MKEINILTKLVNAFEIGRIILGNSTLRINSWLYFNDVPASLIIWIKLNQIITPGNTKSGYGISPVEIPRIL